MACGTPVVTCRNSSLAEIAEEAAIYLDEPIFESIIDVITNFERNIFNLQALIDKGIKRAAHFTWQKQQKRPFRYIAILNLIFRFLLLH